jgi:hypothetical protein
MYIDYIYIDYIYIYIDYIYILIIYIYIDFIYIYIIAPCSYGYAPAYEVVEPLKQQ